MVIMDAFKDELKDNSAEELVFTAGSFDPVTGKNTTGSEAWQSVGNCLF